MSLPVNRRGEDTPSRDEASVVAAAREGDVGAFSELAASYRRMVLNRVRQITGTFDDAEDVTQQALLKAFTNIRGFRGMCSFSSWLMRIAINEALMLKRKPTGRTEISWSHSLSEEDRVLPEIADVRANPEQCYDHQERCQLVKATLKTLKPALREAIEFCDLNENSLRDLALIQGSSLCAAKSRLFRSRHLLRSRVNSALRAKAVRNACLSDQLA